MVKLADNQKHELLEIAVTLKFLLSGFDLQEMDYNLTASKKEGYVPHLDDFCLSSTTNDGQDSFVYECHQYAEVLQDLYNEIGQSDRGCPGVYQYELVEDIAGSLLFDMVSDQSKADGEGKPTKEEFKAAMTPHFKTWYFK